MSKYEVRQILSIPVLLVAAVLVLALGGVCFIVECVLYPVRLIRRS